MKYKTEKIIVPISQIVANPWNPNVQTKEMFEKGVQSVQKLGMLGSILVRKYAGMYQILDGEHRWKYCQELGHKEIAVECIIEEVSDNDAKMLTILLNNLRGKDDIEKRAKIFTDLEIGQLQLLPFSAEEIENEKALFAWDFSQYDQEKEIKKREISRTVMIGLTEEEWSLWQKALEFAKKEHNWSELSLFMHFLDDYLSIRLFRNVDGTFTDKLKT